MKCKVRDREYRIRDFFKLSILEGMLGVMELPGSVGVFVGSSVSGENPVNSFAYACVPQALTYVGARVVELVGKNKNNLLGNTAKTIRKTKLPVRYLKTDGRY